MSTPDAMSSNLIWETSVEDRTFAVFPTHIVLLVLLDCDYAINLLVLDYVYRNFLDPRKPSQTRYISRHVNKIDILHVMFSIDLARVCYVLN